MMKILIFLLGITTLFSLPIPKPYMQSFYSENPFETAEFFLKLYNAELIEMP